MSKLSVASTVLSGILAIKCFGDWYNPSDLEKVDLLKNTSSWLKRYRGDNPNEALHYAHTVSELVAKTNPTISYFSELERETSHIYEELKNSQNSNIYQPVIKHLGKIMEDVSNQKGNSSDLIFSLVLGGMCICSLKYSIEDLD